MMIEGFLKYLRYELNYSVHTVLSYGNDLRQFADFLARGDSEQLRLDDVSTNDIREWMMHLSNTGVCQRTIRRKVQSVRALYKYMQRRGLIDNNPAAMVELAKLPKRLPTYVRSENINALLDQDIDLADFTAVRNKLMLMMFYETGIRRAELIGLTDANVDTSAMQIKVHGKRNKDRIVPFGSELLGWIERYRHLRSQQVTCGCDEFFVRENGKPLYPSLVYKVVHDALQAASMQLVCDIPANLTMQGNVSLVYALFRNLTENSIRYAGPHTEVRVNCYNATPDCLYFSFSDTGRGVPEEHLPRLFERFYRVSEGRTRNEGGTGLGLSIVRNAVRFHHGDISVRNRKEGGLEFLFTLRR